MNKNKESNIENEEFDLFKWDSEISKREEILTEKNFYSQINKDLFMKRIKDFLPPVSSRNEKEARLWEEIETYRIHSSNLYVSIRGIWNFSKRYFGYKSFGFFYFFLVDNNFINVEKNIIYEHVDEESEYFFFSLVNLYELKDENNYIFNKTNEEDIFYLDGEIDSYLFYYFNQADSNTHLYFYYILYSIIYEEMCRILILTFRNPCDTYIHFRVNRMYKEDEIHYLKNIENFVKLFFSNSETARKVFPISNPVSDISIFRQIYNNSLGLLSIANRCIYDST